MSVKTNIIVSEVMAHKTKSTKSSVSNKEDLDNCPLCSCAVGDTDAALCCESCKAWFHTKCEKIDEEAYDVLRKYKSLHWFCNVCNKSFNSVVKMLADFKSKQDALGDRVNKISENLDSICKGELPKPLCDSIDSRIEKAISKLSDKIYEDFGSIKDQMGSLDTKLETMVEAKLIDVDSIKKDIEPSWAKIVAKEVDTKFSNVSADVVKVQQTLEEVKKLSDEEKDREIRSHNIIIYRAVEASSDERAKADKLYCLELFNKALEVDVVDGDLRSVIRIGKRSDSTQRPLLIKFKDKTVKNRVMESLSKLRDSDDKFKSISVTHDLTLKEREECKKLVGEAKQKELSEGVTGEFIWRVRGSPGQMKIVKIRKQ